MWQALLMNIARHFIQLGLVLAPVALAACGGSPSTNDDPQVAEQSSDALTASDTNVVFASHTFSPDFVWLKPGGTLRLSNSGRGSEGFTVVDQATGGILASRSLDYGQSVRFRFSKAGSFLLESGFGSVEVEVSATSVNPGESSDCSGSTSSGGTNNGMGFTRIQSCGCGGGGTNNGMGFTRTESCGDGSGSGTTGSGTNNGMGFR